MFPGWRYRLGRGSASEQADVMMFSAALGEAARNAARNATLDAIAIAFPVNCAGCAEPDRVLCENCRAGLVPTVRRFDVEADGRPTLPTWASLLYEAPLPAILHSFKERGRTDLSRALAEPLRAAAAIACRTLSPEEPFTFVCPPSTRLAQRARGYVPLDLLARRLHIRTARLLVSASVRHDQSLLGREDRWNNLNGSLHAVGEGAVRGRRIILLDDVATTGATLQECARALRDAGGIVLGAVVLAHTERRIPLPVTPAPTIPLVVPFKTTSAHSEISAGREFFGTLSAKLRDR